jgi:hypothetical protein
MVRPEWHRGEVLGVIGELVSGLRLRQFSLWRFGLWRFAAAEFVADS